MIMPWQYLKTWREYRDGAFARKVRLRMKHDRNPLLATIQDKLLVKDYARGRGIEPVRLLHATDEPGSIPFDDLPDRYFIKANHGCGWNIARLAGGLYLFKDGGRFYRPDGSPVTGKGIERYRLNREACITLCGNWLARRYRSQEWAYQSIAPKILLEEAIEERSGGPPRVYRLFTMDGVVLVISVGGPLFVRPDTDNVFFDRNWQRIRMTRETIKVTNAAVWEKPAGLDEMIEAAERLGEGLDFVRVDLYDTSRGVRLGEMTVYPHAGTPGTPSSCPRFNKWLGDRWLLPARAGGTEPNGA
jgi:hypothetical protein